MSLRTRLVAGLLVVAAIGLSVAGTVTYVALQSFMLDRLDQQLDVIRVPMRNALSEANVRGLQAGAQVDASAARIAVPAGTYGELRTPAGATRVAATHSMVGGGTGVPELSTRLPGSGGPDQRQVFSTNAVTSDQGPHRYRVLAEPLPGGGTLISALPLDDVDDTLQRLVVVELVVSGAVLLAVALAGWSLVGRSFRPLDEIADTADAITGGDLSRRVRTEGVPTEVERVGSAMNTMLGRIEDAFAERRASEDRLRQFLSDASHELRTPLTSIRGYAELFRRGADRRPEDLATAMRRIEEEAERMGLLVEDLLLLARLDEHPEVARTTVDLGRLVQDVVEDSRLVQPDRPLTAVIEEGMLVSGDEGRLRQIAGNLLTNALVHTPAGTPVEVRVSASVDEVFLDVADQGPGLDPDAASRVFDRFNRGDPARARSTGGTGLGLAIVSALVDAHDGRVDLDTAPGAGATFRVRFPRVAHPTSDRPTSALPADRSL